MQKKLAVSRLKFYNCIRNSGPILSEYYALINQARGPYEEIFVLTFKGRPYGPNAVSESMSEQIFSVWTESRLITALLYTYPSKTVQDEN